MKTQFPKLITVLLALISLNAAAETRYVDLNSPSPTPPYTNWLTAATNIQDAIDAAVDGDLVLVTNGVYNTGGRTNGTSYLTNRVAVNKPLTLQSVNGPSTTSIEGYQIPGAIVGNSAVRCVYLTNGATLVGFTITNGSNRGDGTQLSEQAAGVFCASSEAVISNCVIVGNFATGFGQAGGGVCGGTLFDCLLMGNKSSSGGGAFNSALYNCTIRSNTATQGGAGVYGSTFGGMTGSIMENCIVEFNSAPSGGGFSGVGTLNNCLFRSNMATAGNGGGAGGGVLSNCTFIGNQALGGATDMGMGGGAYFSSLNQCLLTNNTARRTGGGVAGGSLTNCTITVNTASFGGGIDRAILRNCVVSGNAADVSGGGACSNILINCLVTGNSAQISGGGSYFSSLTNCLVTGNSARSVGGVLAGTARNSILYYNFAFTNQNYLSNTMNYCCSSPLPLGGMGNLSDPPQLVDQFHLSVASPCLGTGDSNSVSGTDLDGQAWNVPPAIGGDEYYSGTATGLLSVVIVVGENDSTTGFATGAEGNLFARISGNAYSNYWDFGDGASATNQPYVTHTWTSPGLFSVKVRVFNSDNPGGVVAERIIQIVDQPVHYVNASNPVPSAPYLSWETAATNIQDAVDAAFVGSSILVSNGVYRYGGKVAYGSLSNRVVVTKPLAVRSVNGPLQTVIQGYQVPGTTNGDAAMRCVFLNYGASLAGFTLTNGATFTYGSALGKTDQDFSGGGIWCVSTNEAVSNCVVVANAAYYWAAGVYAGTLNNCALSNNISSSHYGSAYLSVMNDCILSGNTALGGAGFSVVMNNCLIVSNSSCGVFRSTLSNCTILGNMGGGADSCTLINCVIKSNSTTSLYSSAGGAYASTLQDCQIIGNAGVSGGGINNSTATNCLISGNRATQSGGGAYNCLLTACILSNNVAAATGGGLYLDGGYTGSLTQSIILLNNSAGTAGGGFYLAKNATFVLTNWTFAGNSAGTDGGGFAIASGNVTLRDCAFSNNLAGRNGGGLFGSALASNCNFTANTAGATGGGVAGSGAGGTRLTGCRFTGNLAAADGGGVIATSLLVTNCTFIGNSAANGGGGAGTGSGSATNCTFIGNSASTNGGGVYFSSGMTVRNSLIVSNQAKFGGGGFGGNYSGSTITGNSAADTGGGLGLPGAGGSTVTNCVLSANSALNYGGAAAGGSFNNCSLIGNSAGTNGGGTYNSSVIRCVLSGNRASFNGGGVYGGTVSTCLVVSNTAGLGGGEYGATLNNSTVVGNLATNAGGGTYHLSGGSIVSSIIYNNTAATGDNYAGTASYGYSCTFPMPAAGTGNISNNPAFIDPASGNFRLQTNSPCINVGVPATPGTTDLDGRPRFVGSGIDIGAYEFQGADKGEFIAWLQQSGLPVNGAADFTDSDGDGMNNWQEWIAGTIPTNALSALRLLSPARGVSGLVVSWESVSNRTYFLERAINLADNPAFLTLATNLIGQAGSTSFTDTSANGLGPYFYRVGVETGSNQLHFALSVIPFTWLQQYGLSTDGSADFTDSDGDGMNNYGEWRSDTNPTNALSVLRMVNATNSPTGAQVTWQSVATRSYWLERATNLGDASPFQSIATNIAGASGTTTFTDPSAINGGPYFYRVGVQ